MDKIQKHANVFSERTPIYFRVDLARIIIAINELTNGRTANFVYADLDMEKALSPKEESQEKLEPYDKNRHGFTSFGMRNMRYPNYFDGGGYFFESTSDCIVVDNSMLVQQVTVPTKRVPLSLINGNYEEVEVETIPKKRKMLKI